MFLGRLIAAITALTREVVRLRKVIGLRTPGLVSVRMVQEGVTEVARFALVLPTPGASDVVQRELVFSVAGGAQVTQSPASTAAESDEFDGVEGDVVTGSLVDIDDAGNRSAPRLFEVVLADTIAPPQPGEVGVRMTADS